MPSPGIFAAGYFAAWNFRPVKYLVLILQLITLVSFLPEKNKIEDLFSIFKNLDYVNLEKVSYIGIRNWSNIDSVYLLIVYQG